jgi:hypothetical protein
MSTTHTTRAEKIEAKYAGMPARDRVAHFGRLTLEMTVRRDQAIKEMRQEGASLREIAALAHLSHTSVANIVGREA